MGMYTRFTGQVLVKPEYHQMIADLCDWEKTPNCWLSLARGGHDWLLEFAFYNRSHFIPRGWNSLEEPEPSTINDDGVWSFECEFKNYEGTIDAFMRMVIPVIAIKAELSECEDGGDWELLTYYSPEIAMAPELGNKEEVDLGLSPCLGGLKAV